MARALAAPPLLLLLVSAPAAAADADDALPPAFSAEDVAAAPSDEGAPRYLLEAI
jgi:hypothetical protein